MKIFLLSLFLFSSAFGKVYDCFMFFNEFDILEIRLNELYPYVDHFVLVESCEGHRSGEPKPFYFEQESHRFEHFKDKIIHIKLEEHTETDNGWVRENWQRNQILRGLKNCQPDDLIMISDVDEFIPGSEIRKIHFSTARYPLIGFWQKMYRWFLNRSTGQVWAGTAALRYKELKKFTPQKVRNRIRKADAFMCHMGWHFTSMGGYETVVQKYLNIVEGSSRPKTYQEWLDELVTLPLVPIDETYPQFVQDNVDYLIEKGLIDTPR